MLVVIAANYAHQHFGVVPDVVTMAKALGNGFPIAAFCTTNEIAASYRKPGASTTGGNAVSAAAALAVLAYHEKHNLADRSAELGQYLKAQLEGLSGKYPFITEVRGAGLMLGMELLDNSRPMPEATDRILENMMKQCFLIGKTGINRNVLTFLPPLIISQPDIDAMLAALELSLESCV